MPSKINQNQVVQGYQWSEESLGFGDFAAGEDNGDSLSAGEIGEVAQAEVGDENGVGSQLASYDIIRLGQPLGATGRSAKGKLFAALGDGSGGVVASNTKMRFIARPKNGNRKEPITEWFTQRDLDNSDPSKRLEFPPATDDEGDPFYVKEGRIVAVEVKNPNSSVTVDINGGSSDIDLPALVGW